MGAATMTYIHAPWPIDHLTISRFSAVLFSLSMLSNASAGATCVDVVSTPSGSTMNIKAFIAAHGNVAAALTAMRGALAQTQAQPCSNFSNSGECNETLELTRRSVSALEACNDSKGEAKTRPAATAGNSTRPDNLTAAEPNPWDEPKFTPADPAANHEGESCHFFTKAFLRRDGGGTNSYATGAHVCYGTRFYQCEASGSEVGGQDSGKWKMVGPCAAFKDGTSPRFQASVIEAAAK